ncbi:MAG TPA: ribosome assembly RNA-binding protein YhbY [Tissierellaceae bacterium]|nr:ribosome assembly RNA-binding protein YhbY [Tissierellaceae bacterium]
MLTGKQRAYLKGMANTMEPLFQIGKNGLSDNFIKQVEEALEVREILKIKVLNNSLLDATEVAKEVSEKTGSDFVQSIGNKFVIYKESKENKNIELP